MTCDFQQCGILTSVDSDEPVQPPFKLINSKFVLQLYINWIFSRYLCSPKVILVFDVSSISAILFEWIRVCISSRGFDIQTPYDPICFPFYILLNASGNIFQKLQMIFLKNV